MRLHSQYSLPLDYVPSSFSMAVTLMIPIFTSYKTFKAVHSFGKILWPRTKVFSMIMCSRPAKGPSLCLKADIYNKKKQSNLMPTCGSTFEVGGTLETSNETLRLQKKKMTLQKIKCCIYICWNSCFVCWLTSVPLWLQSTEWVVQESVSIISTSVPAVVRYFIQILVCLFMFVLWKQAVERKSQ